MLHSGQQHRSFIVRSQWLLPVSCRPLENAWLRVERGLVTGFGTWPPRSQNTLKVIDLGNTVITAGFVNAHTHLEFSSCQKPFSTAGGLHKWIRNVVSWKREQSTSCTDPTKTMPPLSQVFMNQLLVALLLSARSRPPIRLTTKY